MAVKSGEFERLERLVDLLPAAFGELFGRGGWLAP
jgi:hypothetical protein